MAREDPTRATFEDRWQILMRDVKRYHGENDISTVNSVRYYAIDETLQELAGMLVEEVHGDEADGTNDSLLTLTEGIWGEIESRMIAWAERHEARRLAGQRGAAA